MNKKTRSLLYGMLCMTTAATAQTQPGTLDPSFGTGGKVFTSFGMDAEGRCVIVQPDGKIIVAGTAGPIPGSHFALARYNTNGTLDNSFGTNGKINQAVGTYMDACYAVALQPDGKILAAGQSFNQAAGTNDDYAVVRYNANGTVDNSFGTNGLVLTNIGGGLDRAYGIAVQPDGKIVVAGETETTLAPYNYSLSAARYKPNGTLDSTFGVNGTITGTMGTNNLNGRSVALQSDGKIVIGGVFSNSQNNFALARLNVNGMGDASFGVNGVVTTPVSASALGESVFVQPDGKIVVGGTSTDASGSSCYTLVRYKTNGTADSSFGTYGKSRVALGTSGYGMCTKLQTDGKILLAGYVTDKSLCFGLARFRTNGLLDSAFGTNGAALTSMGSSAYGNAMTIQPDGRLLVAGKATSGSNYDFAIARYFGGFNLGVVSFAAGAQDVLVYPNPVHGQAALAYTLVNDETLTLQLYDMTGRMAKQFIAGEPRVKGDHREQLSLEGVPAGNYILMLKNGTESRSVRIVKE